MPSFKINEYSIYIPKSSIHYRIIIVEVFKNAVEQIKTSFKKMDTLVILPRINEAFDSIVDVQSLNEASTVELINNITFILANA